MTTIDDVQMIETPVNHDIRGNLSVVEGDIISFDIKRVYYIYDIPTSSFRGGHAHKKLQQVLFPVCGSFDVVLKDGDSEKKITLNKPNVGLLIPAGIWNELQNFSSGSVCLVLASEIFDEADYIRDFDDFNLFKNRSAKSIISQVSF